MKTEFSFALVVQLADDLFEVTVNEGAELDRAEAEQLIGFYAQHTAHARLLVNRTNQYSSTHDFLEAMTTADTIKAMAIYVPSYQKALIAETQKFLFKIPFERFLDRDDALEWLKQQ